MKLSVNEVQMLAQKAARGNGAHPAQAAHFGRAVSYHLHANRGVDGLEVALLTLPEGPIQTWPVVPPDVETPLSQSYAAAMAATKDRPRLPARIECPDDFQAFLSELAHKTYVPATQASRAGGAGAGLTDND